MENNLAPHKTVVWMTLITYEVLPTGECSGKPIERKEVTLQIKGDGKEDCLNKTQDFMEDVKKCLK